MTLRILLVSIVAGMGFEIPTGQDVSSWTRSGRDWVAARLVDLSGPRIGAGDGLATSTGCDLADEATAAVEGAKAFDDLAFEAAVGGMAADFAVELAAIRAEELEAAPAIVRSGESAAVGLPDGEEVASLATLAGEAVAVVAPVASDDEPAEAVIEADEAPSRVERVSSAVRLTREAVQAWATLIRESSEDAEPAR